MKGGHNMSSKKYDSWVAQGMKIAQRLKKVKSDQRSEYARAYADYMQKAHSADAKLRALESLSHQAHYKGVLNYAYARAQKDIAKWNGTEYSSDSKYGRFERKPPETLAQLYAKTNDIERFMNAQTSSKMGITKMYKKRAETMNKKFATELGGKKLSWQEVANYFEKEYNAKLDGKVGSGSQFVALGLMKRYGLDEESVFNDVLKLRKDAELKEDVLKLVEKPSYKKQLEKFRGSKYTEDALKIAKNAKSIEAFRKVERDSTNSGKWIKSPKVERDIAVMLAQDDIDVSSLFEDSKRKGKK